MDVRVGVHVQPEMDETGVKERMDEVGVKRDMNEVEVKRDTNQMTQLQACVELRRMVHEQIDRLQREIRTLEAVA